MEEGKAVFFTGFSPETLKFLHDVHWKNSREWFEQNRNLYNRYLLDPFRALAVDLGRTVSSIDPELEVRPAVNKTISRIHRDTRFSKDKSLYKDRMWLGFKRKVDNWKDSPAFFFELTPDSYRYGMGYYSASRETMDRLRNRIDKNPKKFLKAIAFYKKQDQFVLAGEMYKRPFKSEHPTQIQEWYQRKSFYLVCDRGIDRIIFSSRLAQEIADGYMLLKPIYRYLLEIHNH